MHPLGAERQPLRTKGVRNMSLLSARIEADPERAEPVNIPDPLPLDYEPKNTAELLACARASAAWRICSGHIYKIIVKETADDEGGVVKPFRPNRAQRRFLKAVHNRNVILKARQLGFTTLAAVLWTDHALWVPDQRCGIIAHSLEDAQVIFRDKVKFAYENMPAALLELFPLARDSAQEIVFAHNNSSIRVATSMRSGTINRLHISEMGKIAAKFPQKAIEITTGSLPAVPQDGIAIIESTAEGKSGKFYDISSRAEKRAAMGTPLGKAEFAFHFFPWWITPEYVTDPRHVKISAEQHEYFDTVGREMDTRITLPQRAWWVAKLENEQGGDVEAMWREYPSTPAECWQKSTAGTYFAPQLLRARAEGRITKLRHVTAVPVHTFWDIGSGDGTGIWCLQYVGQQHRFLRYIEDWAQGYAHYVKMLRETGWLFGIHHLPHDATHERQMANTVASPLSMLQEIAPDWSFTIVPRVPDLTQGINMTRDKLAEAWFDEEGCKTGIEHLELYHKKWNARIGAWSDEPEKLDGHSEAADGIRQWAQGFDPAALYGPSVPRSHKRRPKGGMVA